MPKIPKSAIFVIFGATGELVHRKIIPALFLLFKRKKILKFKILAFSRQKKTSEDFKEDIFSDAKKHGFFSNGDEKIWRLFEKNIEYCRFDYYDDKEYRKIERETQGYDRMVCHPAVSFIDGIEILRHINKIKKNNHLIKAKKLKSSIVIQKPFGEDLRTAKLLNAKLKESFDEDQIFRLDHYLGKDAVQNIIAIKFASVFEYLLNKNIVDHVQIIADESIGVGKRGGYYNRTGALKDMVQNHLLQLIALVAMDAPSSLNAKNLHHQKEKIIGSLRQFTKKDAQKNIVLGQYDSGLIDGKKAKAYAEEERVGNGSMTETFVALKCFIDNKRWQGVPFYIRTGKRQFKKTTKIIIVFKDNKKLFGKAGKNFISIDIFPDAGISIKINMKRIETFKTNSSNIISNPSGKNFPVQEAYVRLMLDVLGEQQMLFQSAKEIEGMWKFIDSIEKNINREKLRFPNYAAGSDGPRAAKLLMEKDGREWMI